MKIYFLISITDLLFSPKIIILVNLVLMLKIPCLEKCMLCAAEVPLLYVISPWFLSSLAVGVETWNQKSLAFEILVAN